MRWTKDEKVKYVRSYLEKIWIPTPSGCKRATFLRRLRKWVPIYELYGESGLEHRTRALTTQEKLAVMKRVERGESYSEIALSLGLSSSSIIAKWHRLYLNGGPDKLKSLKRGGLRKMKKPPNGNKEKTVEELAKENEYLRAENEYLKKLSALVQKRKDQQRRKKP